MQARHRLVGQQCAEGAGAQDHVGRLAVDLHGADQMMPRHAQRQIRGPAHLACALRGTAGQHQRQQRKAGEGPLGWDNGHCNKTGP